MTVAAEHRLRRLDVENPAEVAEYERAFYVAFAAATHNRLVRWLWDWDDATKRLRTRVPYSEQVIWVMRSPEGALTDAVAVNVALRTFQSAAYGFAVPPELASAAAAGRVCEFLTFFAIGDHSLRAKTLLWHQLFAGLRELGFTRALGTGSPKIFPIHRWMGAERIGQAEIDGERRNFLSFDLTKAARSS